MKLFNKILRKIPIINNKIKILKPRVEDVLLTFNKADSEITFIDIGANVGQTIEFIKNINYIHLNLHRNCFPF